MYITLVSKSLLKQVSNLLKLICYDCFGVAWGTSLGFASACTAVPCIACFSQYMVTWSSAHHSKFIMYQKLKGYQVTRAVLKLLHGQEGSCLVVGKVLLAWPKYLHINPPNNILHWLCSVLMTIGVEKLPVSTLNQPPNNSDVPPCAEGGPAVDLYGFETGKYESHDDDDDDDDDDDGDGCGGKRSCSPASQV